MHPSDNLTDEPKCVATTLFTMNASDLATVMTILGCPVAAGFAAVDARAGWFTPLFVIIGLALGFAASYGVRWLAYLLLAACGSMSKTWIGWPLLFAYTLLPMIAALGAMSGIFTLTLCSARHLI
jgi:type IV secretory pathway VirB2 component (pilin)